MAHNVSGRTRVLKEPQSRNGCFTCKARRVKCDATKPVCLRCVKGDRQCGYSSQEPPDDYTNLSTNNELMHITIDPRVQRSHREKVETLRLVTLACKTLHYSATFQGGAAAPFWSLTLPQLSHTHSIVGAAAAALGAAIEMHRNPTACKPSPLLRWYVHALGGTRNALGLGQPASTPIIAACMLLAVTETLVGQELFALSHLQGALSLLVQRQREGKADDPAHHNWSRATEPVRDESAFHIVDEVDAAGAALDICTATYALGLEPRLPTLAVRAPPRSLRSRDTLAALETTVLRALHSSYRFAAKYNEWRYVPQSFRPNDLAIPQSLLADQLFRHIEDLRQFQQTIEGAELSRAQNLSAQCISCLIYIACLFEPKETSYDRFITQFEEITSYAAALSQNWNGPPPVYLDLSLDLGCIQPLYFTAFKCRESGIRRYAIQQLERAGREGPFDAKQHAAVARRVMELEERAAGLDVYNIVDSSAASIPEGVRLHGAGVDATQSPQLPPSVVSAALSRCRDVEGMMNEDTIDGFKNEKWWDIWNESLPVSS